MAVASRGGTIHRLARRRAPQRAPQPVAGSPGLFTVDATWGTIQPIRLPGGVETVGELEVIDHLKAGTPLVDTRRSEYLSGGTLPGAIAIPHELIVAGLTPLRSAATVVLFCNGPQCAATPDAIRRLLKAGWDPDRLRYYRGGIHDWVTLGLPIGPAVRSA